MRTKESEEMYLETILLLQRRKPEVRSVDVVEELGFAKSSVSFAVHLLEKRGYLTMNEIGVIRLTEEGRAAQALTLPGSHQGEPVVGMDETLFSENKNICEIIVQPNIGILYDGMFSGCTALEKLILTGEDPSAYAAGDGLRDGADFLICVPEETLDRYRRDYFWQAYAPWIQPWREYS